MAECEVHIRKCVTSVLKLLISVSDVIRCFHSVRLFFISSSSALSVEQMLLINEQPVPITSQLHSNTDADDADDSDADALGKIITVMVPQNCCAVPNLPTLPTQCSCLPRSASYFQCGLGRSSISKRFWTI